MTILAPDELETISRRSDPRGGPSPGRRGGWGSGLRAHWAEQFGPWIGLVALCLALYLPGLASLPPFDRDEARFAQASKQMVETGDFVRIRLQDEPRNKKPIGIYWLQSASAEMFGGASAPIVAYRIPSVVGALGAVLLTFWGARMLFDRRTAFIGASLLAGSLLTVGEAHQAKTDAVLLASTVAAQMALGHIYMRQSATGAAAWGRAVLFWIAIGVGILIKGPVLPMISALTIISLSLADRSWRWTLGLKPLIGVPLAVLITAPWFIAINHETGGGFIAQSVGHDLIPKLLGAQESHGAWPGTYLAAVVIAFFPGSLFVWPAIARAWQRRLLAPERFCLAWLVPAWIVFELIPTKLPHYVLPLYPALALLTARFVIGIDSEKARRRAALLIGGYGLWALAAIGLAAGVVVLPGILDGHWYGASLVPAAVMLAGATWALVTAWRGGSLRAVGIAIGASALFSAMLLETVLPNIPEPWLSRSAAAMVKRAAPFGAPVAVTGYSEPSLVFLLGTHTVLGDPSTAARFLADKPHALALVGGVETPAFLESLKQDGATAEPLDHTRGFNYSKGKWVDLTLYRRD